FYIYQSDNVAYDSNDAINSLFGIIAIECNSISITQSSFLNHQLYGVYLIDCSNFLIDDVTVSGNAIGVILLDAETGVMTNSLISNNGEIGLGIDDTVHDIEFSFNIIIENFKGIYCFGYQNTFFNNTIMYNNIGAFLGTGTYENVFYFNYFIENSVQVEDTSTTKNNEWSKYITALTSNYGNYWSDYEGVDIVAPFGIGDTQYNISATGDIADLYPLMKSHATINPPELSSPSDIFIVHGTTGNKVNWVASSLFTALTYEILVDGVVVESGLVVGEIITLTLDG
ncbi:MAG: right-handed parallel beta-helix repeat-containing protein, partial [Candidatus Heimdallarchaeota archaeon]|nr:right-handed parallel beta-helix repeat-containing protein [Candidatus Heimdallarchaeota archaeon]MCK5049967.1 right-handed parallel beta-helix repeat-containing protein [Candidatus Heimdallarchaeota archaeon]